MIKFSTIEFLTVGSSQVELPLPRRLTQNEVITNAAEVNENSFSTKEGKAQYREFSKQGYRLISWSDGTRAAYKKTDGRNLNRIEAVHIYKTCRNRIEIKIAKLQFCKAGTV